VPFEETTDLDGSIASLDVLYMTRVQRERFFNEEDYLRLRDSYILTAAKMGAAKSDMTVMHPLPRVNEIAYEIDSDPRAAYFRQVMYGKFIRMALILKLLEIE
ncbi:MAG: aspartate carbamoyltransferase, partial [Clostridia bacterium]|nr:aspartate carbamoyltransferase [Clostridia bacterium]